MQTCAGVRPLSFATRLRTLCSRSHGSACASGVCACSTIECFEQNSRSSQFGSKGCRSHWLTLGSMVGRSESKWSNAFTVKLQTPRASA